MKKQQGIRLKMTHDHFQQLERQGNFLGTTRTIMFFLHFYGYRHKQLTENDIETALQAIEEDEKKQTMEIGKFPQAYTHAMNEKDLFLYTVNNYLSALVHWILENDPLNYKEKETRSSKMSRVYNIDQNILDSFVLFSKETGITQGALVNHAIMLNRHKNSTYSLKEGSLNKQRKGLELTNPSIDKMNDYPMNERSTIMNKLLGDISTHV